MGGSGESETSPVHSPGPDTSRREVTRKAQRRRLEGAVIDAVGKRGLPATTVADLVSIAGVSKTTLYDLFGSKEGCFLTTLDTIMTESVLQISASYHELSDDRDRLAGAMSRLAALVAMQPGAARFVLIDSLCFGRAGFERREQSVDAFVRLIHESIAPRAADRQAELAARFFVEGIQRVTYRHLRHGEPELLARRADTLVNWVLTYRQEGRQAQAVSAKPMSSLDLDEAWLSWGARPDSMPSRNSLTQRQRILRGVAQLAAEQGFAALTIPAISAVSGTSNQTFYRHFENKDSAFLAAFDELIHGTHHLAAVTAASTERCWDARVRAYIHALLELIASTPLLARVAFVEAPAAGPDARDRVHETTSRLTRFLDPLGLPAELKPLSPLITEAIGGGIMGAIQHEVAAGRAEALPERADELASIVLAPLRAGAKSS